MYGPPFVFLTNDWAHRDIALSDQRWQVHIKGNRQWVNEQMIPLIKRTIEDPDCVYASDRSNQEAEFWRHFDDVKDGTPDYLKVIIRYDTLIANVVSGDVVTAYVEPQVNAGGTLLWNWR